MARGRRGTRWASLLGGGAVAVAFALAATGAFGDTTPSKEPGASAGSPAQNLLLRLRDLPPGYRLLKSGGVEFPFSSIECDSIEPADPRPRLAAFLARYSPAGCLALYYRLYRVPGSGPAPLVAGTGALDAGSIEAAEAGLAVSRELLSHLLGDELPREVQPPAIVGDASRLYRWDDGLFWPTENPGSFLVWRSGNVVASVFVAGSRATPTGRIAVELAQLQQRRIEAPTPYTPAEQDDTEVALDDPDLDVPILWLGRSFAAGRGLRLLRLFDTTSTTTGVVRAPLASLFYVDRLNLEGAEGIRLSLWSRRQWHRLAANHRLLPDSLRCATARRLKIPQGRAVIFGGPGRVRGACPDRGPDDIHTARIHLPGVVVTAATTLVCATCIEPGKGPYNSFKGMATIARGLERR